MTLRTRILFRLTSALGAVFLALPAGAQHSTIPAGVSHEEHKAQMQRQADHFAHRFDNPDELAKTFDDPARDEWQMPSRVIDALQIAPGQIVADIGAGTGYFTVRLARAASKPKVYAVDIEPSMIEHLRHRITVEGLTNAIAVQAAGEGTNLPEPVDLALIVDTYHHIPNRVAYFTTLKSSLKRGARLAIVDFRKGAPTGPPEEFRFTPDQISAELAIAGFSQQAIHEFLPRQIFLVFAVK
jgi:ubiquinone/menaquinone biosynthesis C-methylase UbiE